MKNRLSVCCGNCKWYRLFLDEMVCTNPEKAQIMEKKQKDDWCNEGFKESEVINEKRVNILFG
jgi:hypothetical protein